VPESDNRHLQVDLGDGPQYEATLASGPVTDFRGDRIPKKGPLAGLILSGGLGSEAAYAVSVA
jgi:hypothetical protein